MYQIKFPKSTPFPVKYLFSEEHKMSRDSLLNGCLLVQPGGTCDAMASPWEGHWTHVTGCQTECGHFAFLHNKCFLWTQVLGIACFPLTQLLRQLKTSQELGNCPMGQSEALLKEKLF